MRCSHEFARTYGYAITAQTHVHTNLVHYNTKNKEIAQIKTNLTHATARKQLATETQGLRN